MLSTMNPLVIFALTSLAAAFLIWPNSSFTEILCLAPLDPILLQSPDLLFRCRENNNTIFHESRLNTSNALRPYVIGDLRVFAGNVPVETFSRKISNRNRVSKVWIELEPNDYTEETQNFPITQCLSLQDTEGSLLGTVLKQLSLSVDGGQSYGVEDWFTLDWLLVFTSMLSLGADYLCSAKPGQTVQLISTPTSYKFSSARFRNITLTRDGPEYGEWQDVPETRVYSRIPIVKCVTDPKELQCGLRQLPNSVFAQTEENEREAENQ